MNEGEVALRSRSESFRWWLIALGCVAVLLTGLGWSASYLAALKPPGCNDPRTLILMGYELGRLLSPASAPDLARVTTVAGGSLAIRYVCSAEFANPEKIQLPDGAAIHAVRFTSTLAGPHLTQRVTVQLEPILQWEKVR